jgi:hypothetical protein
VNVDGALAMIAGRTRLMSSGVTGRPAIVWSGRHLRIFCRWGNHEITERESGAQENCRGIGKETNRAIAIFLAGLGASPGSAYPTNPSYRNLRDGKPVEELVG